MTPRQCEIAAESYAASLLARCGYDIFVQYGANQPYYDLIATKGNRTRHISVKGGQNGAWPLAVKHVAKNIGYHAAIDSWLLAQRDDVLFLCIQFIGVSLESAPRAYVANPKEVAMHMKTQRDGQGYAVLHENFARDHPQSRYNHLIPTEWAFTAERLEKI